MSDFLNHLENVIASADDRGDKKTSKYIEALKEVLEAADEESRKEITDTYIKEIRREVAVGRVWTAIAISSTIILIVFLSWFGISAHNQWRARKAFLDMVTSNSELLISNNDNGDIEVSYDANLLGKAVQDHLRRAGIFDEDKSTSTFGRLRFDRDDRLRFVRNQQTSEAREFSVQSPDYEGISLGKVELEIPGGYINKVMTLGQEENYRGDNEGRFGSLSIFIDQDVENEGKYVIEFCKEGENCKLYANQTLRSAQNNIIWGPNIVSFEDDNNLFLVLINGKFLDPRDLREMEITSHAFRIDLK